MFDTESLFDKFGIKNAMARKGVLCWPKRMMVRKLMMVACVSVVAGVAIWIREKCRQGNMGRHK